MLIFYHWKWPARGTGTVPVVSAHFCSLLILFCDGTTHILASWVILELNCTLVPLFITVIPLFDLATSLFTITKSYFGRSTFRLPIWDFHQNWLPISADASVSNLSWTWLSWKTQVYIEKSKAVLKPVCYLLNIMWLSEKRILFAKMQKSFNAHL